MPNTIDNYLRWAHGNAGNEVALDQAHSRQLDRASNQVSALARFFNTASATEMRKNTMADFTYALSAEFGTTLAQKALSEVGLSAESKLTGQGIREAFDMAEALRDKAQSDIAANLKLVGNETVGATLDRYARQHDTHRCLQLYSQYRAVAVDLLGEMPLDSDSLTDFVTRVDHLKAKLNALPDKLGYAGLDQAVRDDRDALVRALIDKVIQTQEMLDNRPRSPENDADFKSIWHTAALKGLQALRADSQKSAMQIKLDALIRYLQDPASNTAFDAKIPIEKEVHKALAKNLYDNVKSQVGWFQREFSESLLAKAIAAGYRQALNERDWPVIDKTFDATLDSRAIKLQSTIIPGEKIGRGNAPTGPIGAGYEPNVHGYMCHSADTPHAVNLAVSSLSLKNDATGRFEVAFRGVRHGVHCAWEIEDPTTRRLANIQRAREAVIAAYLASHPNPPAGPGSVVHMDLVSVSLLTPDCVRRGSSDERKMLREQSEAWDAIQQGFTFDHGGQTVRIEPNILKFNFGVNGWAVNSPGLFGLGGGWEFARPMNKTAFAALENMVQGFLTMAPVDREMQQRQQNVRILFNQVKSVLEQGEERWDHKDAYKAASRIAVLAHLMGATPCWNCKSGKDRTGEMDVECKFLSAVIAKGLPIPSPGSELSPELKALFRAIAFEGGNFEIQKLNTGFGGYKTEWVSSIPERLGGPEYREFHKGGSSNVGV